MLGKVSRVSSSELNKEKVHINFTNASKCVGEMSVHFQKELHTQGFLSVPHK
jgi:hypothetical protein